MNTIGLYILDNDPIFLKLLKIHLEERFTLFATSDTKTFEETVKQPAVLIIDMFLDGETGIDVMRRIRQKHKHKLCHVIFMSATASKEIVMKSHNEGWGGFFLEKDDPEFWEDIIKMVWHAKSLLREKVDAAKDQHDKDNQIAEQITKTLKSF